MQRSGIDTLTQDTNGKVTNSQSDTTNESQEVIHFPAGDQKAHINRHAQRHSKHKTEKHKRSNSNILSSTIPTLTHALIQTEQLPVAGRGTDAKFWLLLRRFKLFQEKVLLFSSKIGTPCSNGRVRSFCFLSVYWYALNYEGLDGGSGIHYSLKI